MGEVTTEGSLLVPYHPAGLSARVAGLRRRLVGRVASLVITVGIVVVLWFVADGNLRGAGFITFYAVLFGLSLAWLVLTLVRWLRARRALARVPLGTAVRIGRPGVQVGSTFTPWPDVAALTVVRRRLAPPAFRLRRVDASTADVALELLDLPPATLDGAARAYSAGQHGVDLSALDN